MLTHEMLVELLDYDSVTGEFRWRKGGKGRRLNRIAGSTCGAAGYCQIWIGGRHHGAHRLAWFYVHGSWPDYFIDHIDRNPLNNAIRNLRQATPADNARNAAIPATNTSGRKGVSKAGRNGKWKAQIYVGNKPVYLGSFESVDLAAAAYQDAAKLYFGEFATEGRP